MASQTNNPFDFTSLLKSYDPQAFFKQMQGGFSAYQLPNFDSGAFLEAQKKNMDALVSANQAVFAGTQELFKCQSEMLQQAMADATAAAKELASSGNPKELAAKQAELLQAAVEKALANSAELSELVKSSQEAVVKQINERFLASIQELKEAINKLG
ncbi:MAG: TIGR01841 family phasin [Chromatiaceae bacterium]|nr:TIGR01841 family phasin [Chromatiaceae bacterium]MCP5444808.1 TIGR01841 family phasin [Chromatiaceae bacterium]